MRFVYFLNFCIYRLIIVRIVLPIQQHIQLQRLHLATISMTTHLLPIAVTTVASAARTAIRDQEVHLEHQEHHRKAILVLMMMSR